MAADGLLEADDLDVGEGGGDAEFVDEGEDGAGRNAAPAERDEGVESWVVPGADVFGGDELEEFAFGEDGAGEVEATVFALHGFVDFHGVAEPFVGDAGKGEFGGAERVGDVLEAIAQTMREVVGWVYPPFVAGAVMLFFEDAIGGQIPHLRVAVCDVLLHAEEGFSGLIFAVSHGSELCQ